MVARELLIPVQATLRPQAAVAPVAQEFFAPALRLPAVLIARSLPAYLSRDAHGRIHLLVKANILPHVAHSPIKLLAKPKVRASGARASVPEARFPARHFQINLLVRLKLAVRGNKPPVS